MGSVRAGLSSVTSTVLSAQAAVAGLVGAAGMGALVKRSLAVGDALGKTSDKLGIATEQLAGLRLAAERTAGVTGQTLDTALQRMTRRVSEASLGTGAAKNAINELGLSAQQLNNLSPDEQFRRIADAMQGVANQGDRVRLSMQLFDTEGVALVNTLAQGSEALDEYTAQADELGLALSRVDAAQMEAANDAIDNLGAAVSGISNQITAALAPALTVAADKLTELTADTNGWAGATGNAVNYVVEGIALVGQAWSGVKAVSNSYFAAVNTGFSLVTGGIAKLLSGLQTLAEFANLDAVAGRIAEVQQSMTAVSEILAANAEQRMAMVDAETDKIRGYRDWVIETNEAIAESSNQVTQLQEFNLSKLSRHRRKDAANFVKEQQAQAKAAQASAQTKVAAATNYTNAAISLSTALFGESKAAAIGSIVADTAAGIARTWAQLGWPAALPGVAAIAASGAAQLAAAKGASKGGGGGVSVGGGGGAFAASASPVLAEPALAAGTQSEPTRNVSINLSGGLYSREEIRELIGQINNEIGDGAQLVAG